MEVVAVASAVAVVGSVVARADMVVPAVALVAARLATLAEGTCCTSGQNPSP